MPDQQRAPKVGHTPGVWAVNPICAQVDPLPVTDAPICQLLWPTDKRSEEETEANGRLIAAAPEMLEALKAVVRVADRDTVEFRAARAAIAKATGGAQ